MLTSLRNGCLLCKTPTSSSSAFPPFCFLLCFVSSSHNGFKWLKPAKNILTWSDFTNFFLQVSAYSNSFPFQSFRAHQIQNLSNLWRHKYDPSISRIFRSNFWRVFYVWHNCESHIRLCSPIRSSSSSSLLEKKVSSAPSKHLASCMWHKKPPTHLGIISAKADIKAFMASLLLAFSLHTHLLT